MATKKTKAVAKTTSQDLSYLQVEDGEDLGVNFEQGDYQIPRVKICQKMSDSAKEVNTDLKDGDFYSNLTCDSLGDSVDFFALLHWNSTAWFDDEDGSFMGAVYKNPINGERIEQGERIQSILTAPDKYESSVTQFQNYMVALLPELTEAIKSGVQPQIYILSCASAAIKYARQINAKILMNSRGKKPIYSQLFHAETFNQKFAKGSAYMPKFSWPRYATPEEFEVLKLLYDGAKAMHKAGNTSIVVEKEDGAASGSADEDEVEPL